MLPACFVLYERRAIAALLSHALLHAATYNWVDGAWWM
jgi:hypothetical protein